jgi:hypothetical protein
VPAASVPGTFGALGMAAVCLSTGGVSAGVHSGWEASRRWVVLTAAMGAGHD